jgi:tRNA wybutosine-synthesizing protein 2
LDKPALQELIGDDDAERVHLSRAPTPPARRLSYHEPSSLRRAARHWLEDFQRETPDAPSFNVEELARALPTGYSVYPPMLLLSSNAFPSPSWRRVLDALTDAQRASFYAHLARAAGATHVALNAPIPPLVQDPSTAAPVPNTKRSPANLTPLHGDFGPARPLPDPSPADLAAALWVTALQHGVWQTWPPRHVMFSRGNVGEKARLQALVRAQIARGALGADDAAAVDLYAGVGYFAFAYAKAGLRTVLCWEVNAWSVEGMRRGAAMNGWAAETVGPDDDDGDAEARVRGRRLVAFHASNETAAPTLARLRAALPPVRHVNCGLLPSSRPSWRTAVAALDPRLGGWVHVHENSRQWRIALLAKEIVAEFEAIVRDMTEAGHGGGTVTLEHVERVKWYSPDTVHCVFDIAVLP